MHSDTSFTKLSELDRQQEGIIVKVKGQGAFRKRITEMGFVKGKTVKAVKPAPLQDPIEYEIMGYDISLRKTEADLIEVVTPEEARSMAEQRYEGVLTEEVLRKTAFSKGSTINVALVGNPNCGKTTMFNFASGARERVGNYGGVTVDTKLGKYKQDGYVFDMADLPGTYSLTAYTPEELFVRRYILNEVPDIVINILDASNLERNLYLTTQLIDMDVRMVIALNMYDELQASGAQFDYEHLGNMLGIPIVPTVSSKGIGIKELFKKVEELYEDQEPVTRKVRINYGQDIEMAIKKLQDTIDKESNYGLTNRISPRFLAVKLLEQDKDIEKAIGQCNNESEIHKEKQRQLEWIESQHTEAAENLITDARFGFITGALKETYKSSPVSRKKISASLDAIITHKILGFPIFFAFLWLMFQATFKLGAYPMEWIEQGVGMLSGFVEQTMPAGMLKDLISGGIIDGVGGVIVFLPNIIILFLFISFMEDTGYMARAAFIMDKVMHKIGLHGKSFIPLIMGFGCNVPAIMATRTLPNKNDRLLTMLINPFMSCSARLPVYILIAGAIFPNNAGTVIFLMYTIGIMVAAGVAILFKKFFFKSEEAPFVMELPPYRIPTVKATFRHMWNKAFQYLKKMGGVILVASIIIWALGYFPRTNEHVKAIEQQKTSMLPMNFTQENGYNNEADVSNTGDLTDAQLEQLDSLNLKAQMAQQKYSYIGKIGRTVEPVVRPLGFDWKMAVGLVTGIAAKEIVVSTMGVLYLADGNASGNSESLRQKIARERYESGPKKGQRKFTPVAALSFLIFTLIYFPCIAVIAAIRHETGSWKWAVFTMLYTTSLAWILSFITYQVGSLIV